MKKYQLLSWVILGMIGAISVWLSGCNGVEAKNTHAPNPVLVTHKDAQVQVPENSPLRLRLETATIAQMAIERSISAPALIEAAHEKLVKLSPPLPGRIVRMHRSLGDAVKTGDALFTLDSAELSAVYGERVKALATLRQVQQDFERQQRLWKADIVSKKDFETAQAALDAAQSDARVYQAHLSQLGIGENGNQSPREYTLRAPISGRVIEMAGAQGGFWNDVNAPIMTVADLSTVWLSANVAEKDIAAIFIGQKATITLNAYPAEALTSTVKYIGEVLDPETRTIKVRLALENTQGKFRPGMFARVTFLGQAHSAPVVPTTALLQSGLYTRVFVEKTHFIFESRIVETGSVIGDWVEITSGLQAGEKIVVKEGVLLND